MKWSVCKRFRVGRPGEEDCNFFGKPAEFPVPDALTPAQQKAWNFVTNWSLHASVGRDALVPLLRLRVPIWSGSQPFSDSSPITRISVDALFEASLQAPDTELMRKVNGPLTPSDNRSFGLSGTMEFGSGSVTIEGLWPIDGDSIILRGRCQTTDLTQYLTPFFTDTVKPTKEAAEVSFRISKQSKSLRSIAFSLQTGDWTLIPGLLVLQEPRFDLAVQDPGIINLVSARFSAVARLGGKLELAGSGSYPDGTLQFALAEPVAGDAPQAPVTVNDVIKIFHAAGIGFADDIKVSKLSGRYQTTTSALAFELVLEKNKPWNAGDDLAFQLLRADLSIFRNSGKSRFRLAADFQYTLKTGKKLLFGGRAEYSEGWSFAGLYENQSAVSIHELGAEFGIALPDPFKNVSLTYFAFAADIAKKSKSIAGSCAIKLLQSDTVDTNIDLFIYKSSDTTQFRGRFQMEVEGMEAGKKERIDFQTIYNKEADGSFAQRFTLQFTFAGREMMLDQEGSGSGEQGAATNRIYTGSALKLNVRLKEILFDQLQKNFPGFENFIPAFLIPALVLEDIYVRYDGPGSELTLFARGTNSSKSDVRFFLQKRSGAAKRYAFGISTDFTDFTGLPLVGGELEGVALNGVGFVYVSQKGGYKLPELKADDKGKTVLVLSEKESAFEAGINLTGALVVPRDPEPVLLSLPLQKEEQYMLLPGTRALTSPAALSPAAKWFTLNKKMGPLTVSRVGFAFKDQRLSLLISGSISFSGITMSVEGMEVSFLPFNLTRGANIEPKFNLLGLGLAYEKDPLLVSGMFLQKPATGDEEIAFSGLAQIKTSKFSITGIGAYARLTGNRESLFVYGIYNGPIGGPAFFFVTGIAAGFGYNSRVRIPELEKVPEFPLVALALGSGGAGSKEPTELERAKAVLASLNEGPNPWLPSSPGDYWLAVGVKFTSFKIIESFVLLTVQFGNELEFALIGLSVLKWPSAGKAIAYIELAVLARFGPGRDAIEVRGMLTPNSFLLDPNCKLSGGFAFYAWVSGKHEGDFVITLGGYHPLYKKPDHYPNVDRLALNWKFSDALSIRGEMYFALTPKAIMAGGRWEIEYRLSFLTARLSLWADMYISWAPYYYDISAGIVVSIEANIKILFVRVHFRLQMGCTLHIWGPPFAGEVYVDWSIFSFTIPFGDSAPPRRDLLEWSKAGEGFRESFVPKGEQVLDAKVTQGAQSKDQDGKLYVDPYSLVLRLDSFFPVSDFTPPAQMLRAGADPEPIMMEVAGSGRPVPLKDRTQDFGIAPMGITDLKSDLKITVKGPAGFDPQSLGIMGTAKSFNSALWSDNADDPKAVIKNVLSGMQLHARETKASGESSIILDKDFFVILDPARTIPVKSITEQGTGLDDKLFGELKKGLVEAAKPQSAYHQAIDSLTASGFGPFETDLLLFDQLHIDRPDFWIGMGEGTPKRANT